MCWFCGNLLNSLSSHRVHKKLVEKQRKKGYEAPRQGKTYSSTFVGEVSE